MKIAVGSMVPDFSASAVVGDTVKKIRLSDFRGKWVVLYSYTKDDTALCASENHAFSAKAPEFEKLNAQLIGLSVDTVASHREWQAKKLGPLPYPWIADESKELCEQLGILHADTGLALRTTLIINPDSVLRYAAICDLATGRSIGEVLRVLQALQTGKPTPCDWQPGEPTL